jgi:hypothetical protein
VPPSRTFRPACSLFVTAFLSIMSHAFAVKLLESVIDAKTMFVRRLQRKSEEQHCWLLGLIRGISSSEEVVERLTRRINLYTQCFKG